MPFGARQTILFWVIGVTASLVLIFFSVTAIAYRDWAFICENTGSRKGYREWFFGLQTRPWYQPTSVEKFMAKQFPAELQHRWTSYAGTGKNIYGGKLLYGHGRPGVILQVPSDCLNSLFDTLPASEKKAFYDLLLRGNKEAILNMVTELTESDEKQLSAPPR